MWSYSKPIETNFEQLIQLTRLRFAKRRGYVFIHIYHLYIMNINSQISLIKLLIIPLQTISIIILTRLLIVDTIILIIFVKTDMIFYL